MHKELVDRIHKEKAKNDSNSRDLASTLNVLSKTVFGEVNRFIFELLQNADDSSSDENPISVEFQLLENYLVFSHDGKHFTKEDVMGISSIGSRISDKDKNIEKTGYKGIGFKSVFGTSDYAHIVSGGFSFRFDKNFEGYTDPEEYPWQVVPIWTDQPAEEVNGVCKPERVNTIIRISDRQKIKQEIINVFEDCQIILFLRKVKKVVFFDGDKKIFEVSKNTSEGVVALYNNGKLESSWIFKIMDLPISDELSKKLDQLSDTECPRKLKEAKATKLTFAAQVNGQNIIPVDKAVIYSYLPTKAQKGFCFLINGDFLTNAERTELMPNIWNEFLFEEIARLQLEWFYELRKTLYRFDVLKLLKGKYLYPSSGIEIEYNKGLEFAASTIDFLPKQADEKYTLVITNGVVDSLRFSECFNPTLITEYLDIHYTHSVIDIRLKNQDSLIALGAQQFTFSDLLKLIGCMTIDDVEGAIDIIGFFYNNTFNGQNPTWLTKLEEATFIMDDSGQYKTPKEIFIPIQTEIADISFEGLHYVHPKILARYGKNEELMLWLQDLGVREPTDLEIVRKAIIPMILNDGIDHENVLGVTRFIFKVYQSKLLSDTDYDNLKLLKVSTSNGLKAPQYSYFSDYYNPEKKLSTILPYANFLTEDYVESHEDCVMLKAFFKKIGVRENISIDLIEEKIERQDFERRYPDATAYLNWLENIEAYPKLYHSYRYSGQHYIQNHTEIEFKKNLQEVIFAKFFWAKMLDSWDLLIDKCIRTYYYRLGGYDVVPSYIQYYVQNFECIPCTDGKCYKSIDVFAPSLKSIIGNHFPVADFPVAMTVGQIDFFKFKKSFSAEECLQLLDLISSHPLDSDTNKQLSLIYDQLISQPTDIVRSLKTRITEWKANAKLLTIDNIFQDASDLYIYAVHNVQPPLGTNKFLKVASRSKDEIKALSDFLSIPMITYDMLEFVPINIVEDAEIQRELSQRVPFLALICSKKSTENYGKVLSRIRIELQNTKFINAESLSLVYNDQGQLIVDSKVDCWPGRFGEFYFTGKWDSPITLYNLSNSLCGFLKLDGMEREFGLIMKLQPKKIREWLFGQGYPVNEISEEDDLFTSDAAEVLEEIIGDENSFTDLEKVLDDIFTPEVTVDDIDFKQVEIVVNNLKQKEVNTTKIYAPIESSQVKIDIGKWSEEYVNKYLLENSEIFTEITWYNETSESYLPYDFTVKENGIVRYIEVKGTPSLTKEMINLSAEEWKQMFVHGDDYSIFRVYGAGTIKSRLERNDNIRSEIEVGKLLNFPIEIFLR
ncbi:MULTISPECIES: DUF3883 domain-containing protein [unclassified Flavobacterium]|uniref:DUF3883 domain-containing protein n=1 Tax=unclassified Flavobacterium TaxID=196869 RepID=UPI000961EEFF|nr:MULTISPECIES: DUF3883 domain-containing protein [unclassified Flavobacterium]MBN9285304.1 DUF3883 domain-containing protein [Flavobacterium sp.]OJV71981.1 MAG: hypothetical protein BGO42_01040 [Flavobacterium sp. 40-81]